MGGAVCDVAGLFDIFRLATDSVSTLVAVGFVSLGGGLRLRPGTAFAVFPGGSNRIIDVDKFRVLFSAGPPPPPLLTMGGVRGDQTPSQ